MAVCGVRALTHGVFCISDAEVRNLPELPVTTQALGLGLWVRGLDRVFSSHLSS